ncbi:DNA-methyltransferase [Bauldia litoralis]|uniref:DNA-methyltransferase n=1 Tax=Bauldia litoralis TaxID=665467 RepID=UPI0032665B51
MITVLTGDCRDVLRTLADGSFDCIIVDPPYGETSLPWDRRVVGWPAAVRRLLKPTGSMWVFGSQRMFLECAAEFDGWKLAQDIVWEKHNGTGLFADRFRRVHEHALQFYLSDAKWGSVYKDPQYTNDARARTVRKKGRPAQWIGATGETVYRSEDGGPRLMRSVIFARSEHGRAVHPTQKPIEIVEPLLLYSCPPSGAVLDPFAGSGTVGLVAARHQRDCTLVEANEEFWPVIQDRMANDAPLFADPALSNPGPGD